MNEQRPRAKIMLLSQSLTMRGSDVAGLTGLVDFSPEV